MEAKQPVPGDTDGRVEEVVPVVPEGGNTKTPSGTKKRCSPWKRFTFTLNNYSENDWNSLVGSSGSMVPRLAMQEEDESTPHLQGFGEFEVKKRPSQFWKEVLGHNRTHFEKMKGTLQQNIKYCTDIEKRVEGGRVYMRGCPEPTVLMTRALCRPIQLAIADKYTEREDPLFGRNLHWYFEAEGNWGKSKTATYMIDQMGATELDGAKKDMLCGLRALIEQNGQCPPIVIVDIPRDTDTKYVSYAGLEKIKDGKFFSPKYESGMCRFNIPHIVVFSNDPPMWERMSLDRWKVFNVTKSVTDEIQQEDCW